MFTRTLISTLALIGLFAGSVCWYTIRLQPHDAPEFHKLITENVAARTQRVFAAAASQKREGVQKDIWVQDETRHFQIQSETSDLTLMQKSVIENLKQVRCAFEGDSLTADEGTYVYPSHQFIASNNCCLKEKENIIEGSRLQFDLVREIVTYDNPKGHIHSTPLDFTAKTLIWHRKEGKLFLEEDVVIEQPGQFTLLANKGTLTLDELHPALLVLEGYVRLISTQIQNKESYAIADAITYDPSDETLLLSADKKVLFWQEGLTLSATEVLIKKNRTVEGHGNVHFSFDLDEQNHIDEFFKQYL